MARRVCIATAAVTSRNTWDSKTHRQRKHGNDGWNQLPRREVLYFRNHERLACRCSSLKLWKGDNSIGSWLAVETQVKWEPWRHVSMRLRRRSLSKFRSWKNWGVPLFRLLDFPRHWATPWDLLSPTIDNEIYTHAWQPRDANLLRNIPRTSGWCFWIMAANTKETITQA